LVSAISYGFPAADPQDGKNNALIRTFYQPLHNSPNVSAK